MSRIFHVCVLLRLVDSVEECLIMCSRHIHDAEVDRFHLGTAQCPQMRGHEVA